MFNFYSGKKVLLTGATGFIGNHLCDALLAENAQVVCPVRNSIVSEFFKSQDAYAKVKIISHTLGDLGGIEHIIAVEKPDIIFHLAAKTPDGKPLENPAEVYQSNIDGAWQMMEACRRQGDCVESIVFASSDKAYGNAPLPYREKDGVRPSFIYETAKAAADMLVQSYGKTYGMPVAINRSANMFGERDLHFHRIIPQTMKAIYFKEKLTIRGDGYNIRDYLYVQDGVSGYMTLGRAVAERRMHGEAFNFTANNALTVLSVIDRCVEASARTAPEINFLHSNAGEITDQFLDGEHTKRTLGWTAQWNMTEAMRRTWDWYSGYFRDKRPNLEVFDDARTE